MEASNSQEFADEVRIICDGEMSMSIRKKRYASPRLVHQRHLRDITLNPSATLDGESGGPPQNSWAEWDLNKVGSKSSSQKGIWEEDIFSDK